MSAQPKPSEPSMEEILASIRRIISDDDVKPAEAAVEPAPVAEEPPVDIDEDVLDLGSEAARIMAPEPEPEPVAPPVFASPPPPPSAPFDMAQLLSDQSSSAVTNAFGQLAHTVLSNNARTLEDLVKDMLKPMLKGWLDDNLPTMVERLVRAEIERVARGGRH